MSEITLGISTGHDSGVALLNNQEIEFAANEERFSRIKGHSGFPFLSLQYIFENFDSAKYIEKVALDGKLVVPHGNQLAYSFATSSVGIQKYFELFGFDKLMLSTKAANRMLNIFFFFFHQRKRSNAKSQINLLAPGLSNAEIKRFDHHFCHAASVAFPRGGQETDGLIITLDGIGEGICSRILKLKNGKYESLDFQPALGSPALMYGYATAVLGYKINRHEGKLTGLAAYGDPNRTKDIFLQHFTLDNGNRPNFKAVKIGYGLRGIKTLKKELETFSAQDIAAGVQAAFEEIILEYVSYWIHSTNCNHLYLSGGAFANVALNAKIALLDGVERLSIAPNMGDGGLALGAAALAHNQPIRFETLYLGSSLKNTTETSNLLELVYEGAELPSVIASFLKQKKTVALVQGRMEFGPRALCNRSILYSAEDVSVNSWLNERLKRTEYMPFAPVCRDVDAHKNFHLTLPLESYRHMTITCKVTDWCKATAPAIVHIDSTARPQILSQRDNPFMYSILNEYAKIAENPVLVNTSFNMHEEPIVNTGDDAVRAFLESGVTFLVLNDRVFRKRSEV